MSQFLKPKSLKSGLRQPRFAPIAGDWNGDGLDSVGVFDQNTETMSLISFGQTGDIPLAGDWGREAVETVKRPCSEGLFDFVLCDLCVSLCPLR